MGNGIWGDLPVSNRCFRAHNAGCYRYTKATDWTPPHDNSSPTLLDRSAISYGGGIGFRIGKVLGPSGGTVVQEIGFTMDTGSRAEMGKGVEGSGSGDCGKTKSPASGLEAGRR